LPKPLWERKFDVPKPRPFEKTNEITVSIIENFPERLRPEVFVWMDVTFIAIDSTPVDSYLNHTDASDYIRRHGGEKLLQDKREIFVSFAARDKNKEAFFRCLGLKEGGFSECLLSLKSGDKLRLGGRINKMNTSVQWFLVDAIQQF
jgi:hypothetical protein